MISLQRRIALQLIIAIGLMLSAVQTFGASPDSEIVAVSSSASSDYIRSKLPDGTYALETFAFGKGGFWPGTAIDSSIDKIQFIDVARTLADPLAYRSYISSQDPKTTKLLIMVYWGKTNVPPNIKESVEFNAAARGSGELAAARAQSDPKKIRDALADLGAAAEMETLESRQRDRLDAQNASMLGYGELWNNTAGMETGPLSYRRHDLIDELEDRRYFVVIMAYDFQLLWKQKKRKLLWETRFSIRDRGHEFDKALSAMAQNASKYFGQDTHGVVHKELPEGRIEFGEIKVLDDSKTK